MAPVSYFPTYADRYTTSMHLTIRGKFTFAIARHCWIESSQAWAWTSRELWMLLPIRIVQNYVWELQSLLPIRIEQSYPNLIKLLRKCLCVCVVWTVLALLGLSRQTHDTAHWTEYWVLWISSVITDIQNNVAFSCCIECTTFIFVRRCCCCKYH